MCWLLIYPAKAARHVDLGLSPAVIAIAPSLLGPAGLLFVLLSSERRFARLSVAQATLAAGSVAFGLEFAQVLPGVRRLYTFDWLDVAATLVSLGAGSVIAAALKHRYRTTSQ